MGHNLKALEVCANISPPSMLHTAPEQNDKGGAAGRLKDGVEGYVKYKII